VEGGRDAAAGGLQSSDLEEFLGRQRISKTRTGKVPSQSTIAMAYRHLRVFFNWLADREDVRRIMTKVAAPAVQQQPVPIFTNAELRRLMDTTKGKGFSERRDRAILSLFLDTGCRRAEISNLTCRLHR